MSEERTRLSTRDVAQAARREEAVPRDDSHEVSLFPHEEAEGFRARWDAIQTGFVDEPKTAVGEADALVAQVVTRLAQVFSDEKDTLEQQWGRGDSVSTEDLRIALKRYRAFFHRLLSL
jgi:hypothetical protein